MLASRACRSSIMIGKALDKRTMDTILEHLSQVSGEMRGEEWRRQRAEQREVVPCAGRRRSPPSPTPPPPPHTHTHPLIRPPDAAAQLQSPWNCPHGRPTMRHLCLLPEDAGSLGIA